MSVVARRLSACVPQEALSRRASPTAHDLGTQMCHLDSAFFSAHTEENGCCVHREAPCSHVSSSAQIPDTLITAADVGSPFTAIALNAARRQSCESNWQQQGRLCPDHLTGRRRSFDVTWISAQTLPVGRRRSSLRSPLWRAEHRSPTLEHLMTPLEKQRVASTSSGKHFFGRAWQLDEELDNEGSAAEAPGLTTHHLDLSPILPSQRRRQSWGPSVFSPSPGNMLRFQTTTAATRVSPRPMVSPSLLCLPSVMSPFATLRSTTSEENEQDAERGGKENLSNGMMEERASSVVPDVTINSAGSPIVCVTHTFKDHSKELHAPTKEFPRDCSNICCKLPAVPARRASWHTSSLETSKTGVSTDSFTRCPQAALHLSPASAYTKTSHPNPARPGSVLGKGGFGIVKLGSYKGRGVAVKVLKERRAAATSTREAKVLSLSPHDHLAWTLAVVTHAAKDRARVSWSCLFGREEEVVSHQAVTSMFRLPEEDAQGTWCGEHQQQEQQNEGGAPWWAWVVSELCLPHSLLTLINDTSLTLTNEVQIRYTLEVCRGLAHLHAHGIAHRDLKPANILLTVGGHLKIADFGCCARLDLHDDDIVLGTVRYQAPEVLRGKVGGSHSDVFSLGVTTWHLMTRILPYDGLHPHIVIYQVAHLRHRPTDHQPHPGPYTFLDAVLWRLVRTCWAEEPTARPTAVALCRNLTLLHLASTTRKLSGVSHRRMSCSNHSPFSSLHLPPSPPPVQ